MWKRWPFCDFRSSASPPAQRAIVEIYIISKTILCYSLVWNEEATNAAIFWDNLHFLCHKLDRMQWIHEFLIGEKPNGMHKARQCKQISMHLEISWWGSKWAKRVRRHAWVIASSRHHMSDFRVRKRFYTTRTTFRCHRPISSQIFTCIEWNWYATAKTVNHQRTFDFQANPTSAPHGNHVTCHLLDARRAVAWWRTNSQLQIFGCFGYAFTFPPNGTKEYNKCIFHNWSACTPLLTISNWCNLLIECFVWSPEG